MRSQDPQDSPVISASDSKPSKLTEREQSGLRGPVKSCVEETTYPTETLGDGKQIPELKLWTKTEYDEEGRVAAIRMPQTSRGHGLEGPVWVTRYTYSPAGLLLKVTSENDGGTTTETVYRYDDQGRLQSITDSQKPDNPIVFRYDENGRKTKLAISRPEDYPAGLGAVSYSTEALFKVASRAQIIPGGGIAMTIYDEQDRPVEIQVRNTKGELLHRLVRKYDNQGNILEEKETMDDPLAMIPDADQNKILNASGMSVDDLRGEFAKFLGGTPAEMFSTTYTYDKQGRKSKTARKAFNHADDTVETTYNDHGDVDVEITRSNLGSGDEKPQEPRYSEAHYSYEYDSYGNWTEKEVSYRSSPEGNFTSSFETQRTFEYF